MSCGCKTSGDSAHSCGTKSSNGCENVNTCGNSYKLSVFDWLSHVKVPSQSQCDFVEVRFKNDRKVFYQNTNQLPLHVGSIVTVEASPGHDTGVVSLTGELVKIQMKKKNYRDDQPLKVYRIATSKDVEVWQEARKKEDEIKLEARKIATRLHLEMKITDVEFQGDGSKVTFYYTAEGRVDFRQLIKDYAATFKTKIDMKQIGYRQESAKVGGIGSCGRELCCSTWLTDFRSVNTNAARYQQLSINPLKLAGQCGKLKCCLNFELDSYVEALGHFPSSNTVLDTEKGRAFCIKIDVFKKRMWFAYVDNSMIWHDLAIEDVKEIIGINKKGGKAQPLEDYKSNLGISVPKEVDLIQENSVDRFEKKRPAKKSKKPFVKNENEGRRPENKKPGLVLKSKNENTPEKPRSSEDTSREQEPKNNTRPQKSHHKKFKKKQPPKKDQNGE